MCEQKEKEGISRCMQPYCRVYPPQYLQLQGIFISLGLPALLFEVRVLVGRQPTPDEAHDFQDKVQTQIASRYGRDALWFRPAPTDHEQAVRG
jgi:hypothetical protein